MGSFLKKAFHGDIRCRDRVTFEKASRKTDQGHAMRAMKAYAKWMEDGSDEAKRELAILRIMGLFDRPADAADRREHLTRDVAHCPVRRECDPTLRSCAVLNHRFVRAEIESGDDCARSIRSRQRRCLPSARGKAQRGVL